MWAVSESRPASVRLLLERGAEAGVRTRVGQAPSRRAPNPGGSHGVGIVRSGWPARGF
jgi:hypothetical protein